MSNRHPINDIKTPEELHDYVGRVVYDIVGKFCTEQINRFGDDQKARVVRDIHEGAITGAIGSLCLGIDIDHVESSEIVLSVLGLLRESIRRHTEKKNQNEQ
jgi:hypothetical protein